MNAEPVKHAAIASHDDPLWCQCGFPVDEYNLHILPYEVLEARLASAEAEVARFRTIHECECDSEVGHDEYCVNNLFDRMEAAEAALARQNLCEEHGSKSHGTYGMCQPCAVIRLSGVIDQIDLLFTPQDLIDHGANDYAVFCDEEAVYKKVKKAEAALKTATEALEQARTVLWHIRDQDDEVKLLLGLDLRLEVVAALEDAPAPQPEARHGPNWLRPSDLPQ